MSNSVLITTSTFSQFDNAPLTLLKSNHIRYFLNPYQRKLSETELTDLIVKYQPTGIIAGVEPITKKVFNQCKRLKVISRAGIGMDSIDLEAAEKRNIIVTNTPDAPTIPVAELTLGMILSLLRKIHKSDASIRNNEWLRPMGDLLYKRTIGIIGCGRIGSYLAKLLSSFDCTIFGNDPGCSQVENIMLTELEHLFSVSDIVSLHIPYSFQTHHFINEKNLKLMKKGAFLVNCSRGGLVDESALYESLKMDHLAGAALDCFENEPYVGPLGQLDNVILTAHIGSYAREGRIMMEIQATKNLIKTFQELELI